MSIQAKPVQQWRAYWSAALFIDGVETTFSCNHNHHTEGAAKKCVKQVEASARKFMWNPTFQETVVDTSTWIGDDPGVLIEWSTGYLAGRVTTRFRKFL